MRTSFPAIRVENLGKCYHLGQADPNARTFREALVDLARAPMRRFRGIGGHAGGETFWALDDVSFEVAPGEVVGIIGRNGAGKSTLLKILSRITEPTCGRVSLRGRVASLLEVGTGFHPELTGRENIYLNGAILGMTRAEINRKFGTIVDFAEIEQFLDTPVKRYSSGMYVRLAFAVAAHLEPEILLIDEVLAVGDTAFQRKCLGKMQDVSRGGRTVLFVSHNMGAVASLCGRVIVLDEGKVVFSGPAEDAVNFYLQRTFAQPTMTWDLSKQPRSKNVLGTRVHLERVEAQAQRADGFLYGEPLRFRIEFVAAGTILDLGVAVGVDDVHGTRVITFESEREGVTVDTQPGTLYVVELAVPPFGLSPGSYLLSVSLYSGNLFCDYLVHFGLMTVNPIASDTGSYVASQPGRGAIRQRSEWCARAATRFPGDAEDLGVNASPTTSAY